MSESTTPSVVEVDADGGGVVYRTHHDMSTDGLTLTICVALAEVTGRKETDVISDFSRYADPDALNRLFRTLPTGDARQPGAVTLHIADHEVTIHSDGEIVIEPL